MKKEVKTELTKKKLINAANELMNQCNTPEEVTSRAIAAKAGVQLSMINYCFGSRDALMFAAFSTNEREYLNNPRVLEIMQKDILPKEKLKQIHYIVCEFLINEYRYSMAITGYVLLHRDLSKGLHSLPLVILHYGDRKTEAECKIICYELSSVMQLAVYRKDSIKEFCGIDLSNRIEREKYIDMQIDLFLQ